MNNLKDISNKSEKIRRGLELAYERMIEFKKSKNTPLVVSVKGKIVEIDPYKAPPTTSYS